MLVTPISFLEKKTAKDELKSHFASSPVHVHLVHPHLHMCVLLCAPTVATCAFISELPKCHHMWLNAIYIHMSACVCT